MLLNNDYYISYLNLDYRTDRLEHVNKQFERVGIEAVRTRGKLPAEYDLTDPRFKTMLAGTKGAIGCYMGQLDIMREALKQGKHAAVFEDDIYLAQDFNERIKYFDNFLKDKDWSIAWLGATFHIGSVHWHNGTNPRIVNRGLYRDAQTTSDPRIFRTFGAFCTYAYAIHKDSIQKVIDMLEERLPTSIGIDFSMIEIQPDLLTYAMVPGMVRQIDNRSDIGYGDTIFSGFAAMNGSFDNSRYWFQENINDFDPLTFDWAEAKR